MKEKSTRLVGVGVIVIVVSVRASVAMVGVGVPCLNGKGRVVDVVVLPC